MNPDRVINALRNDPVLAFEVMKGLKVFGRWHLYKDGRDDEDEMWERYTPSGVVAVRVSGDVEADGTVSWYWAICDSLGDTKTGGTTKTFEGAVTEVEQLVVNEGAILVQPGIPEGLERPKPRPYTPPRECSYDHYYNGYATPR